MSDTDEQSDKQHEPTQKKLDDARRKGEIPKSNDLITAAGYGGLLVTIFAFGISTLGETGAAFANLIARADTYSAHWFAENGKTMSGSLIDASIFPLSGWFLVPAGAVILAIFAQRAFVFAPSKLEPKLSRISPISNAKNKFGRSGLFEFLKSFVKLVIYSGFLFFFLYRQLEDIVSVTNFGHMAVLALLANLTINFLAIIFVIAVSIGALDFMFQRAEHIRKHRMSHKELTDETKMAEGDPHMKQQRRQKGYEIAMNSMLADVPEADVVIVNPTHYAVALKWTRAPGSAPECVAKGVDETAAKIREIAAENGVAIHRDPPTARALFASVDVGEEVKPEHYKPVAAAIRFADGLRKRAGAQRP